ncbi:MAG: cadherin domain-containing protein [Magnetococcales bacterium]|nr:cadherin domain-containing protein [Magnetococcales bacterium]
MRQSWVWLGIFALTATLFYPLGAVAGPGAATLVSPSGSISNTSTPASVTFTWNAVSDATYYSLKVMNNAGNITHFRTWYPAADVGCSSGTGTCSITPTTTFAANPYSWSIRTYGDSGMGATTVGTFTLSNTSTAPGLPSGTIDDTTPTYRWSATKSATYYQLRVTTSSGSSILKKWYDATTAGCKGGTGNCSITPTTVLADGNSYLWYIKPWTTSAGTESSGIAFTIGIDDTSIVSLTSPSGETSESNPTYTWTAKSDVTHYRLRISDSNSSREYLSKWYTVAEAGCSSGTGNCSVTPNIELGYGNFTWEITSSPDMDKQTQTFTTIPTAVETPTPSAPSGAIDTVTPAFVWSAVTNATDYKLKVTDSNGTLVYNNSLSASTVGCSSGTGTCTVTPSLTLADGASSWTVTAYNTNYSLVSAESSALSFTVAAPDYTPGTPTPTYPSGTIGETTPTYRWSATENSTHYTLEVSNSSGTVFSTQYTVAQLGCSVGSGTCSVTPTTALSDGDYTWTLLAYNSTDDLTGTLSAATSFTVSIASSTVTLVSPVGSVTETAPTFSWSAIEDATSYRLKITSSTGVTVHRTWYSPDEAGCSGGAGTCSVAPGLDVGYDTTTWSIYALPGKQEGAATFTASLSDLPSPTIVSPNSSTESEVLNPTFSWTAVADATHYIIQITDSEGTKVMSGSLTSESANCASGSGNCRIYTSTKLPSGTGSWSIQAVDTVNDRISSTTSSAFTISATANEPGAATPIAPNEAETTGTPAFSWTAAANATHYKLIVADSSAVEVINHTMLVSTVGCTNIINNCSITFTQVLEDGDYSWSIQSYSNKTESYGTQSAFQSFSISTSDGTISDADFAVSPSGILETATPGFVWSAIDSSTNYRVKIQKTSSSIALLRQSFTAAEAGCDSGTVCSVSPGLSLPGGSYLWEIMAFPSMKVDTLYFSVPETSVVLSETSIDENSTEAALVGTLSLFNDTTEGVTYTLGNSYDESSFVILNSNELWKNAGVTVDYESDQPLYVAITSSTGLSNTFAITINDTNDAPTDLLLIGDSVLENADTSSALDVGTLSVSDPDALTANLSHTYSVSGGSDQSFFQISGNTLQFVAGTVFDRSSKPTYEVEVQVTDGGGLSTASTFTVTLLVGNYAPTDLSLSVSSIDENLDSSGGNLSIGTLTATDTEATDTHTFTVIGGTDQALFAIAGDQLQLVQDTLLNYETLDPASLTVEIQVEDSSGNTYSESLTIDVNDVNDAPTDIAISADTLLDTTDTSSAVDIGALTTSDEDSTDSHTYSITGGDDQALFTLTDATLQIAAGSSLSAAAQPTISVEVTTTDSGSPALSYSETLVITLENGTRSVSLANSSVNEDSDTSSGTNIGALLSGGAGEFTLIGGTDMTFFEVIDGSLYFVAGTVLDYETKSSYEVIVQDTDAAGTFFSTLTVTLNDVNEAPTEIINATGSVNIIEISTTPLTLTEILAVDTFTVTDQDSGDSHTFSITGGTDSALFEIADNQLQFKVGATLTSSTTPLEVEVTATDSGGLTLAASFSVTVVLANQAPTDISLSSTTLPFMDRPTSMSIGTLTTTDANEDDTHTYTITDDFDGTFIIEGDQLEVVDPDSAIFGIFSLEITSTDSGGLSISETFSVSIGGFSVEDIPSSNSSVAAMEAAARTTYASIYKTLFEANSGSSVVVTESDLENMIIGKVGQQFTSGNTFSHSLTDVVKQFNLEISSSLITATMEIGVIDAIYDRLPASVQSVADSLFETLTPYASDYTAGVRVRIVPQVSGQTLSFNTATSYVDVLHEDSLLTPNLSFSLSALITQYNNTISNLSSGGLSFFRGGGSMPPLAFLQNTLGDSPEVTAHYEDNLTLGLGPTYSTTGQSIPTSQSIDYYFPSLVNGLSIGSGNVTLTR